MPAGPTPLMGRCCASRVRRRLVAAPGGPLLGTAPPTPTACTLRPVTSPRTAAAPLNAMGSRCAALKTNSPMSQLGPILAQNGPKGGQNWPFLGPDLDSD